MAAVGHRRERIRRFSQMEHASSAAEKPAPQSPDGRDADRLTVFYDGSCPLCRNEISFLQRQRGADAMIFEDISATEKTEIAPGLSCVQAMARMHVQLPNGEIKSGAAAFLEMWGRLPRLRPFVRVLRLPPLPWLLERAYRGFLVIRPWMQRRAGGRSVTS